MKSESHAEVAPGALEKRGRQEIGAEGAGGEAWEGGAGVGHVHV